MPFQVPSPKLPLLVQGFPRPLPLETVPLSTSRQRLRFEEATHESTPDGHCRVTVRLEWCGRSFEGVSEGVETQHGRVRSSAEACLHATLAGTGKRVHLELIGVKAVRAFDGWVVVTRLVGEAEGRSFRLLGASSCEDATGLERSAALAVLDATNRVLERYVGR